MTTYEEIAAILHPLPDRYEPEDAYNDECWAVEQARKDEAFALEVLWDAEDIEPLDNALNAARSRRDQAEAEIRQLIAYGREFTRPRPYTLTDLASSAGMSFSGVRTAYDHGHVAAVEHAIGRRSRDWRATDPSDQNTGKEGGS